MTPPNQFKATGRHSTYPVSLLLGDRLCIVVGGGEVGARKANALREAGARVRVVARKIDEAIRRVGGIELVEADYDPSHLMGARLVIAATDSRELNRRISDDARACGCIVNVVDDPDLCDFIVPAVMRRGDLSIAVETAGASPALARNIRQEIESLLPAWIGDYTKTLRRLRREVLRDVPGALRRRAIFEFVAGDDARDLYERCGEEALRRRVNELIRGDFVEGEEK